MAKSKQETDATVDSVETTDATVDSGLKKYEVWRAEAMFKYRMNEDTGTQERYLVEVKKRGAEPISTTHIEPRQADELNSQVENSNLYYFEC